MSNIFKLSLASIVLPVLTSIIGFFIIPHQVIVQFNQPTYDNKIWIFLTPAILIFIGGIFTFFVIKDRKKQEFYSPVIATALEYRMAISNFILVFFIMIVLVCQIIYGR